MLLALIIFAVLLKEDYIQGFDLNSLPGRTHCYLNEQPNCHRNFIDEYPHLSKSATNLSDADTYFLLFTRRNPEAPEKLHKCAGKLPPDTNFNPCNELIVILTPFIAGFCDIAAYREWLYEMLKRGDYNVLVVDYSWGNHIDYGTAIMNIKIVAQQTVIVLQNIQDETRIAKNRIHLIGHSLGAQLAGLIGKDFPVRRITGLDPAGPGFAKEKTPPEDRLDPSDADFVDVWHCNAGRCLPQFGINYDAGHANFYINGGTVQLACRQQVVKAFIKKDFIYGIGTFLMPDVCYHAHCAQYFRVSINPGCCQFLGVRCKSYADFNAGKCNGCGADGQKCLIMGFDTDKFMKHKIRSPQRYYLNTTDDCPYCVTSSQIKQSLNVVFKWINRRFIEFSSQKGKNSIFEDENPDYILLSTTALKIHLIQ